MLYEAKLSTEPYEYFIMDYFCTIMRFFSQPASRSLFFRQGSAGVEWKISLHSTFYFLFQFILENIFQTFYLYSIKKPQFFHYLTYQNRIEMNLLLNSRKFNRTTCPYMYNYFKTEVNLRMKILASRSVLYARFSSAQSASAPYKGVSKEEAWKLHQQHMFPFYKPYYKEPFFAVRGSRQYLYDDTGKEFLDLAGGISTVNVGHCHPRLNDIFTDQVKKLMHISPIYLHEYHGEYIKELCKELGEGFDVAYLCNSGSQANDFAYQLARLYTGSERIYAFRKSYHGVVGNAYSLTNVGTWCPPMPKMSIVEKFAYPSAYRNPHLTVDHLIQDAEEAILSSSNHKIAGVWAEPIMGVGGIVPLPDGYFKRLADLTHKYGGLVVSDEVQTGFGRIGKDYWGFKHHGVKPDIVVTAKAMANGYPLAAVITSRKIMSAFTHNFFNTYGAGVLQCRLGLEVLKIIRDEKLPENAEKMGEYFLKQFRRIQKKYPRIGDVRGKGMMTALEFVKDPTTKESDPTLTANVLDEAKNNGVLFAKAGQTGNIVRIVGPLCLNEKDAQKVVQVLEHSVAKFAA